MMSVGDYSTLCIPKDAHNYLPGARVSIAILILQALQDPTSDLGAFLSEDIQECRMDLSSQITCLQASSKF